MDNPLIEQQPFAGAGVVRALLRAHDWRDFPYGPPGQWSLAVRRTIDMLLDSGAPMSFLWGADHLCFYNDAYIELLADEHPAALGRPFRQSWSEVGETFAPVLADASAGRARTVENLRLTVLRKGSPAPAYFTCSLVPLFDERGEVAGLLNHCLETSAEVFSRQRRAFQLELAKRIASLGDPGDVVFEASELLGAFLGVDRVAYATVDGAGQTITIGRDWTSAHLPSMQGRSLGLDDFGALAVDTVRAGKPFVAADIETDERSAPFAAAYTINGIRAVLAIPLMKDGRLSAILNLHHGAPRPWSDADIGMAEDMVDRTWSALESVRANAELRHERDQSSDIFDNMIEGFALLDSDWRILRMNAEGLRLTQQTAEGVVGRNHWELWPDLLGTEVERLYLQVMGKRQAASIDIPYALPEGDVCMEVRAYPTLEGGLVLFFRDISKRRNSEKKMREDERRKDEFLAMLAHELRNPLAPISAAADLLQVGKVDEARVRQTSQIIGRQVRHMTGLVDDLLDVSRVTRGLVELQREPLDIHRIVADAVEQVTPLVRARRHRLALELTPDAPLVEGDRKRLVQVFANLLNNAAKYTPEGGHIGIRTDVRQSHVLFHVSDDGIGMAPDLAARAFDLFTQAERSPDRSLGGLGLGLALVKSLVGLHGGTVSCASPGLGQGSSFTVCLPRRIASGAPDAATTAVAATTLQAGGAARSRIMVVDDNVDAAAILAMLLEAAGHEVLVEHGAREALARSKAADARVFLLDIGLPGMDGNELAQGLRAQPETAGAVLIAITGYGQEADRVQSRAAGFDHHLVKPVDMNTLYAILAEVDRSTS